MIRIRVVVAVARRPRLWWAAIKALRRVGLRPSRGWWEWRLHTAYGDVARPDPADVVLWLRWCQAYEKSR